MTEGSPENNSIYLITESQLDRMLDYVEDDLNHSEGKYKDARALAADIRLGTISSLAEHDAAIREDERKKVLGEITEVIDEYVARTWNSSVELSDLRKWIKITREKPDIPMSERGYTTVYANTRLFPEIETLRSTTRGLGNRMGPQKEKDYQCGDECNGECSGEWDGRIYCPVTDPKDGEKQ